MATTEAALKAWETRRANERSEIARKAWKTRRRNGRGRKAGVAKRKS